MSPLTAARMGRPLRLFEPDVPYFITNRTMQGRYLLRPSAETNNIVGAALARAATAHGVKIYAYVVTSNHLHLIISGPKGSISNFMRDFKSWSAKKVGRLINWPGSFWHRRFSAEPIVDNAALRGRYAYIIQHGVKECLVDEPEQWPGLHCAQQLRDGHARVFKWFDATAEFWARLRGVDAPREQFEVPVGLELAPPPFVAVDPGARAREMNALVDEATAAAKLQRADTPSLGVDAIIAQDPHTRPTQIKTSPRPLCHASTLENWRAYRSKYRAYVTAFRDAVDAWKLRKYVAFPLYAHSPGGLAPTG